ncbi:hypothetical protein CBM2629_B40072 [Cupriavidus taiwanensis]|nr:hypothetical protein CBM2629_B40072 [Cupriavidus taiwanensis]
MRPRACWSRWSACARHCSGKPLTMCSRVWRHGCAAWSELEADTAASRQFRPDILDSITHTMRGDTLRAALVNRGIQQATSPAQVR